MTLRIYSTCPQSKDVADGEYRDAVVRTARWSEEAGCTGMLVYTDNSIVDPWLVAQTALAATERLAPLVAVQPVYMHPYTAATMVSSFRKNSSSTETFAGPDCGSVQWSPASSLTNTPTSVPT